MRCHVKKRLVFEFEDEAPNSLTYEYGPDDHLSLDWDERVLILNRPGARLLAEILAKLSEGAYVGGFHLHLRENFDLEKPDAITLMLTD